MSTIKQEDLDEQRGVKRGREFETNLTDELVHCINKARLAQRYLGIRPPPSPTGEPGDLAVDTGLGGTSPPYKAEQNVVFVYIQCESMGRIEKPKAGEREKGHVFTMAAVDSAICMRNWESPGWHWNGDRVGDHVPTEKSRFQRSQATENSNTTVPMAQGTLNETNMFRRDARHLEHSIFERRA